MGVWKYVWKYVWKNMEVWTYMEVYGEYFGDGIILTFRKYEKIGENRRKSHLGYMT